MSVQVQPNWSDISGAILSVEATSDVPGFGTVTVRLDDVNPVEGFANFVDLREMPELTMMVPYELIAKHQIRPGDHIACRVRRAGLERTYVNREHITVERA